MEMTATNPVNPEFPPFEVFVSYELIPNEVTRSVPADATAFRSRGPQPNAVIVIIWDKEKVDGESYPTVRAYAKEIAKIIESTEEKKPEEYENDGYANYGMFSFETGCYLGTTNRVDSGAVTDPNDMLPQRARELWGGNYPRLQQIKKKYDPSNVFNRWFAIQPAA
jgi:hypothetical protein